MHLRPRTWFIVSLLLFVAAAYFWHLGERRRNAARDATGAGAERSQGFNLTNVLVTSESGATGGSVDRSEPLVAASVVNTRTNPFAYRLTNTVRSVAELAHDERGLLLRNALLDTANPALPVIPAHLKSQGEPGSYIVQAQGSINEAFRRQILDSGAELVSYIPNNAMLVRATAGQARGFENAANVAAVLPFEPYYKLDSRLLPIAVEKELSPYGLLNVVAFPKATKAATEAIGRIGGEIVDPQDLAPRRSTSTRGATAEPTPFGDNLIVKLPASKLAALAQIPEVQMIGVRAEKRVMNDLTRVKLKVSTNAVTPQPQSHYLGLIGSNVLVGITDSGADATHRDLEGRILNLTVDDAGGHGTHVAGTLLGNGIESPSVPSVSPTNSAAQGSTNGAMFTGMAPGATGYVHHFQIGTDIELQERAALAGVTINNNSWAYNDNDYDIFAASYDAAVRDSLRGVTGEQGMTYVFSAGNSGGPSGTVLSPATAKNVITVGASELLRRITNEVWKCSTNGTCVTNTPWLGETDSDNQVAPFSSRGNVGIGREGRHGRFKPDVVAPGAMTVSCMNENYVHPSGTVDIIQQRYNFEGIEPGGTNRYLVTVPIDTLSLNITVETNSATTRGWSELWIDAEMETLPVDPPLGSNSVTLVPPAIGPGTLYFTVGNPSTNSFNFDVVITITITNDVGNYWEVLQALNESLGGKYRYESGTSMSAAAVSGMLAQMQEYYVKTFNTTNSAALNKALLVNGARSLSTQYNLDPHATANSQGWGLANLSNSAPAGLEVGGTQQPMYFFDQNATNLLATGDSDTYTITVPPRSRSSPLRITLAWTDPAGNPVSGPKLVNDLDLYVDGPSVALEGTNATFTTNRWIGNNFASGTDFIEPILLGGTNGTNLVIATNIEDRVEFVRDTVNNVENVYIAPPLGDSYTLVVKAHRVNVNAVPGHTNGIVQDYALVVSSGIVVSTNTPLSVAAPVRTNNPAPYFTIMQKNGLTNGIALMNQRVGANSPFLSTTNGTTNQWAFYVFTNMTDFTNVAIITFSPPNLGFLRPDMTLDPRKPRFQEADIDLYVARNAANPSAYNITNLDPAVVNITDRSTRRGGTEFVVFSNAVPNEAFYIGVKAEDQQAATFGLFAIASQNPFSQRDASNNIVAQALMLPMDIPDGSPDEPGGTNLFALVMDPEVKVQRVYVTNIITHENAGDLIGILQHNDTSTGLDAFATLNNHRYWFDTAAFIYDDSEQDDIPDSIRSDGPGTLRDFVGHQALGVWQFTISDNALFHTGRVDALTLVIEPASTNSDLPVDLVRTIQPRRWLRAPFDVASADITNVHACVAYNSGTGPVNLYLRRGQFPTLTAFDKDLVGIVPPGDCLDLGFNDSPPLSLGRYFVGVYNDSDAPVDIHLTVRLDRSLERTPPAVVENTGSTPLLDDATTNSFIFVSNRLAVSGVEVDVRLDHPRASELALYLVNPQGSRVLLAENRGRDISAGYGIAGSNVVVTNFGARVLNDSFENSPPRTPYFSSVAGDIISGWLVESGEVDFVHAPNAGMDTVSHTGTNAIDMNGWTAGVLVTNVPTVVGRTYLLRFVYSRNPDPGSPLSQSLEVEMPGAATNQFTYSTFNAYNNLMWSNAAVTFRAVSNVTAVRFRSLRPTGNAGNYIDTVTMDEIVVSTNGIFTTFTDDMSKLPMPIKFAPPPFGDTNFTGTNIFISGFEGTNGLFTNSMVADGWFVRTNSVFVRSNNVIAYSDTNFALLRRGTISRVLPTEAGKEYRLEFAARANGALIHNTGVDNDQLPLEFGETDPHYWISTNLPDPLVTYSNSIVIPPSAMGSWFNPTNGPSRWISFDPTNGVAYTSMTYRTTFDLRGYNTNTVVLMLRMAAADSVNRIILNGAPLGYSGGSTGGFVNVIINNNDGDGFRQRLNTLEFVVNNAPATPNGLRLEASLTGDLRPNAVPRVFTAVGNVRLLGSYTNSFTAVSDHWRVESFTFVAPSNNAILEFEGETSGVWIDHVQMRDTGRRYYLPEEPMGPLLGESAYGEWHLQLWDTRLGVAVTNANLLTWRLHLSYVQTNPPLTRLTNGMVAASTVVGSNLVYFVVNLPCDSAIVTNTLTRTAGPGTLDLLFNQDTFPTGNLPGDVLSLDAVTAAMAPLEVGYYPLLRSGPYYLAVRNTNPGETNDFTLRVQWVCASAAAASRLSIAEMGMTENGMSLSWTAEPGAEFTVLYSADPAGPWTAVPTNITSSDGTYTFTDDGSQTGGLGGMRFYRLIKVE